MCVKKTSSLENIFTFDESEKSLKKTTLMFLFTMSGFNEPEKKQNLTHKFGTGFKEQSMTKMLKLVLDNFFHFTEV